MKQNSTNPRFPYVIQNPPTSARSSLGRTFIYVLMLNIDDESANLPFYVGQTNHLTRRFGNHSQVAWHFSKFDSPAKIWIAGTVDSTLAAQAEQDLIKRLSEAGYWLSNSSIQNRSAKLKAKSDPLTSASQSDIKTYVKFDFEKTSVLDEWHLRWNSKTGRQPQVKKLQGESIPKLAVETYMKRLAYRNSVTRALSLAITEAYNPDTGIAYIDLAELQRTLESKAKFQKQISYLKRIWVANHTVGRTTPDKFTLSAQSLLGIRQMMATNGWTLSAISPNAPIPKAASFQGNPPMDNVYEYVKATAFGRKSDKDFNLATAIGYDPELGYSVRILSDYDANLIRDGRIEKLNKFWIVRELPKTGGGAVKFVLQESTRLKILKQYTY